MGVQQLEVHPAALSCLQTLGHMAAVAPQAQQRDPGQGICCKTAIWPTGKIIFHQKMYLPAGQKYNLSVFSHLKAAV